jgi:hypothetical protein
VEGSQSAQARWRAASFLEGNKFKHVMFIEDTNLILSVDVNSLSQELSHSLDIATATDLEKLRLPSDGRSTHHNDDGLRNRSAHSENLLKIRLEAMVGSAF